MTYRFKAKYLIILHTHTHTHIYTKRLVMALHSLRRQGSNPMAAGGSGGGISSIALLQERFRQLQKMKEKRQEIELLKLFPGTETMNQTNDCESNPSVGSLEHPEIMTRRPCFQDSLSLGLNLYTKQAESQTLAKQPLFVDFRSVDSTSMSTTRAHDKPEVDTSLHL